VYVPDGTNAPPSDFPSQDNRNDPSADAGVASVRTVVPEPSLITNEPAARAFVVSTSTAHDDEADMSNVAEASQPNTRGADVDNDEKSRHTKSVAVA
jgi:hypothetical protein